MLKFFRSHSSLLKSFKPLKTCSHNIVREQTSVVLNPEEVKVKSVLEYNDYFDVRKSVSIADLFDARVHLGHKNGLRHKLMERFIFGERLGCDIIDLEQTLNLLYDALNFTAHIAYREGIILFIGKCPQMMPLIENTAKECGEYAHCREWKKSTFTNSVNMYGTITRLPDLCVFISMSDTVFDQHLAVLEAAKLNIPTIAITDTNCDPSLITYPIPGNDDSPSAIRLYCKLFKSVILQAKEQRLKDTKLD